MFHARRQGSLHHFADGRHIVVGYPPPKLELTAEHHGRIVGHLMQRAHLVGLAGGKERLGHRVENGSDESHIGLRLAQRNHHAHAHSDLRLQVVRHAVGELSLERQGQYDVYVARQRTTIQ